MRPHSSYAPFMVSRITIACRMIRHCWRKPALDRQVVLDKWFPLSLGGCEDVLRHHACLVIRCGHLLVDARVRQAALPLRADRVVAELPICIYIYIYIYVYTCAYEYDHVYSYMSYTYIHVYICIYIYTLYTYIYIYICTYTHTSLSLYIYIYIYVQSLSLSIYIYIYKLPRQLAVRSRQRLDPGQQPDLRGWGNREFTKGGLVKGSLAIRHVFNLHMKNGA